MHCNGFYFRFNISNFNYFIKLVSCIHLIIKMAKMVFKMIFVRVNFFVPKEFFNVNVTVILRLVTLSVTLSVTEKFIIDYQYIM